MTLPVFVPRDVPRIEHGNTVRLDYANIPHCRLCPEDGLVDDESGLGLGCWRVVVLAPAVEHLLVESLTRIGSSVTKDPALLVSFARDALAHVRGRP